MGFNFSCKSSAINVSSTRFLWMKDKLTVHSNVLIMYVPVVHTVTKILYAQKFSCYVYFTIKPLIRIIVLKILCKS